jgi:hypothetical protein
MSLSDEVPQHGEAPRRAQAPAPQDSLTEDWLQDATLEEMMAAAASVQISREAAAASEQASREQQEPHTDQQDPMPQDLPYQFRVAGGFELWHRSRSTAASHKIVSGRHRPSTALGSRNSYRGASDDSIRPATAPASRLARSTNKVNPKNLLRKRVCDQTAWRRNVQKAKKGIIGGYCWQGHHSKDPTPSRLHPKGQKTLDEMRSIFKQAGMSTHSIHGLPIPHYALVAALPWATERVKAADANEHWKHWPVRPYMAPNIREFFKANKAAFARPAF